MLVSSKHDQQETLVMFDCGFSTREVLSRLKGRGYSPESISAIVVTHEHGDHTNGVVSLARRYRIPVWMSCGTFQNIKADFSDIDVQFCRDGESFAIGNLQVGAFTISHDAAEPLQYHVTDGMVKFGMLTDTGQITPHIERALEGCDALMLEFNYDEEMLEHSEYPPSLKRRISSKWGHLSNTYAGRFLSRLVLQSAPRYVIGAHLSQNNNRPDLARVALDQAVEGLSTVAVLADQANGFEWVELS